MPYLASRLRKWGVQGVFRRQIIQRGRGSFLQKKDRCPLVPDDSMTTRRWTALEQMLPHWSKHDTAQCDAIAEGTNRCAGPANLRKRLSEIFAVVRLRCERRMSAMGGVTSVAQDCSLTMGEITRRGPSCRCAPSSPAVENVAQRAISSSTLERNNRQMPATGEEANTNRKSISGLTGHEGLWPCTGRSAWPVIAGFESRFSIGRSSPLVDLVWCATREGRVGPMLVIPKKDRGQLTSQ